MAWRMNRRSSGGRRSTAARSRPRTSATGASRLENSRSRLSVTRKSARRPGQRLRKAWEGGMVPAAFAGPAEADETFMSGKRKTMPKAKRRTLEGRGAVGEAAVAGMAGPTPAPCGPDPVNPAFDDPGEAVDAARGRRKGIVEGAGFRFYCRSALSMPQCADGRVALTVTSPPYWNAIDYDIHARRGRAAWHRERAYRAFGETFEAYLANIAKVFEEVLRATAEGGFCAIVVGTILHKGRHYPTPMLITERMIRLGWEFHQDIVWNKVTGGVKRAGVFIQHRKSGYYYPNIMTEYVLIFRKPGEPRRGRKETLGIDELFTRDIANNVWHIAPVPPNTIDHPCTFPEELARRLILLYSDEGDEVLDPFLGSGQTALAALKNGRACVGYDVEEDYLRLAETRILSPPPSREFNLIPRFERLAAR